MEGIVIVFVSKEKECDGRPRCEGWPAHASSSFI